MSKRVLSIGQCAADHYGISTFLRSHFTVEVDAADSAKDAFAALQARTYDLVLVNRLLDRDGSPGLAIIRRLKADQDFAAVPIMLVSNYENAQQEALAAGATRGFGKAELSDEKTLGRLRAVLV